MSELAELSQKTVVTGSSGIAASVVRELASQGHQVFVLGSDAVSCAQVCAEINQPANWHEVDLRDEVRTRAAFSLVAKHMGGITGLVAVAGGSGRSLGDGDIAEMSLQAWDATLSMNLTPTFLAISAVLNHMRSGGSIVAVSSVLASDPQPDLFRTHAYATAKGAINSLVTSVASAYASTGIRVNAVAPGLVTSPMSLRAQQDSAIDAFIQLKQPLSQGFLSADEVAKLIIDVLTTRSMTGQCINIDGGWGVTRP